MGVYLAELQISVDTTDIDKTNSQLDLLEKKARELENKLKSLSKIPKPNTDADNGSGNNSGAGRSSLKDSLTKDIELMTKTTLQKKEYVLQQRLSKLEAMGEADAANILRQKLNENMEILRQQAVVKQQTASVSKKSRKEELEALHLEGKAIEENLRLMKERASLLTRVSEEESKRLLSPYQPQMVKDQSNVAINRDIGVLPRVATSGAGIPDINKEIEYFSKALDPIGHKLGLLDNIEKRLIKNKDRLGEGYYYFSERLDEVRNKVTGTTKVIDSQEDQFIKLRNSIDPASAALHKLEEQQRQLNSLKSVVPEAEFKRLNSQLAESRKRMQDLANTSGKTQKEINFAMRGLPAQFTDIVVSLQGGQAPLTVLLQQGGQIKDMFGGVGSALKAMGGYVLSLINPFTVLAGVIASVGLVFYDAYTDASQFNKAIFAGKGNFKFTADELKELALSATSSANSFGEISESMKLLVAQGMASETSLVNLSSALAAISDYTGKDVEDLSSDFQNLGSDVEGALSTIISKYGLIDEESYNAIRAAIELGDTQKAVDLISETVNANAIQRHRDHYDSLTTIGKAWEDIKSAMLSYYQDFKGNFSRTEKQNLEMMRKGLDYAKERRAVLAENPETPQKLLDHWDRYIAKESEAVINAERRLREEEFINKEKAKGQAIVEYSNSLDKGILENRTAIQKKEAEINALRKKHTDQLSKGVVSDEARLKFATLIKQEEAELAQMKESERKKEERANKPKKGADYKDDQATKLSIELDKQTAALRAQLELKDNLTSDEKAYKKALEEVSLLQEKATNSQLTAAQKSILAEKEQLLIKYKMNAELSREIINNEKRAKIAEHLLGVQRAIAATSDTDAMKYQDSLMGMSISGRQLQKLQAETALQRDFTRKMKDLANDTSGNIDKEATEKLYRKELDDRLVALKNFYAQEETLRGDWTVGMNRAISEYGDAATDIAGMTATVFGTAFKSMEDAIYQFATTGKASFADFATSILSDIARMGSAMAANSIIKGLGNAFGGGDGLLGSLFSGLIKRQADGGAWFNGVQMFAKGGAFTNSVVSKPTAFNHSNGLGVMGEAGPEAIMPLTRTSDGQLGVQAVGGGGSSVVAPVTVTIQGGSSSSGNSDSDGSSARAIQKAVAGEVEKAITLALRPGGSIWLAQNGR